MAKPYEDYAGNGLHAHFSILDSDGDEHLRRTAGRAAPDLLGHAIAGCLAAMPGSTLIFAPHATSYDRFVPGAHAPTGIAWAHENRTRRSACPPAAPPRGGSNIAWRAATSTPISSSPPSSARR
jgi:glutamine synthetase